MKRIIPLLVLVAGIGSGASAQLLAGNNVSLEGAKKVAAEALRYGAVNNAPGAAVAVVDAGGNLLYLERLDKTFAAASGVAIHKAQTAALFKAPSSKLEDSINGGRPALITAGHTFLQGGIPIVVNGEVIGAIGVSGSATAQQDEEMAIAGANAILQ